MNFIITIEFNKYNKYNNTVKLQGQKIQNFIILKPSSFQYQEIKVCKEITHTHNKDGKD